MFGSGLYASVERAELPEEALLASLGCGNPVAVADLHPGERVLDLGSGGGIDVLLSARRVGPAGFAYGVDMTEEMLALARANAAKAGAGNVQFLQGTIEDLPLPDASVDVVISNCVINLSADKPAVLAEMFRVLVPGGRIGISDVVAEDQLSVADRADAGLLHRLHRRRPVPAGVPGRAGRGRVRRRLGPLHPRGRTADARRDHPRHQARLRDLSDGSGLTNHSLARRVAAETVGTGFLVAAVVGSGIAAQRLSPGDVGLQLLANSIATGTVLVALILALQPVSAAFNPVVTVVERAFGRIGSRAAAALIGGQLVGGLLGVVVANLMFGLPPVSAATTIRGGPGQWLAEVVATAGLVLIIFGAGRSGRADRVAVAVGGYITAAYWFTSSTSFANPAVTIARMFSDTFTGIDPASVPAFLAAQVVGGAAGYLGSRALFGSADSAAHRTIPAGAASSGPG